MQIQTLREDAIALFASLRANPITPETPQEIRLNQYRMISDLMDALGEDAMLANFIWDLVPPDIRQTMLLSGLAAIGGVIETQINQQGAN